MPCPPSSPSFFPVFNQLLSGSQGIFDVDEFSLECLMALTTQNTAVLKIAYDLGTMRLVSNQCQAEL